MFTISQFYCQIRSNGEKQPEKTAAGRVKGEILHRNWSPTRRWQHSSNTEQACQGNLHKVGYMVTVNIATVNKGGWKGRRRLEKSSSACCTWDTRKRRCGHHPLINYIVCVVVFCTRGLSRNLAVYAFYYDKEYKPRVSFRPWVSNINEWRFTPYSLKKSSQCGYDCQMLEG